FVYVPDRAYIGPDSFSYKVNDGVADSDAATILLDVTNVAPTISGGSYNTGHNDTLAVDAPGVLAGASDADGDELTAIVVSGPAHGTLTVGANGSFVYVPDRTYAGLDSFTFKANDGIVDSDLGTVTINVSNVAPVATGGDYATTKGEAMT